MIRAIIVEDELNIRKGLMLTTKWENYNIEVIGDASNGREGYELAKKLNPDIIITDIRMPLMDGISMLEKISEYQSMVAIVLSGFSEFDYAKRALQLGAVDFLVKPFTDDELHTALLTAKEQVERMQILKKDSKTNQKDLQNAVTRYLSKSDRSQHQNIKNAISFIHEHYNEDISIKSICESMGVSESYLTRLFRKETTYSFHEYLTVYRMKVACDLLMETDIRIYEVANAVGFRDQRYFSSVFKKYFGMSPNYFKEQQ